MNVCDPDKPVPDTFIVRVPLFTFDAVVAVAALPVMLMPHVPDAPEPVAIEPAKLVPLIEPAIVRLPAIVICSKFAGADQPPIRNTLSESRPMFTA